MDTDRRVLNVTTIKRVRKMRRYVLTTIVASIVSCSLLLAEDTATQQVQSIMSECSKMSCCKMKDCKAMAARSEKITARLKAKAQEYNKLAGLFTKCADAQQKVTDAAKAVAGCNCKGVCKDYKNSAEATDEMKKCGELCGKLMAAKKEAMQAYRDIGDYKRSEKKIKEDLKCTVSVPCPDSTEVKH